MSLSSTLFPTYTVTPMESTFCHNPVYNYTPTLFQPVKGSPCSLGHTFINQVTDKSDPFVSLSLPISDNDLTEKEFIDRLLREFSYEMTRDEENALKMVNAGFLREQAKTIKTKVLTVIASDAYSNGIKLNDTWKAYFHKVGELLVPSALADMNNGVCDDSAKLAVGTALKDQLKWGYRENVGIVVLGEPETHAFSVSNFKDITDFNDPHASDTSKAVSNLKDYSEILKSVVPANPKSPVMCCDAWLDYHGDIESYVNSYNKKIIKRANEGPHLQEKLTFTAHDYSIPSFRKDRNEDNPEFRCFVKNSLRWMLSVFERIHDIHQISVGYVDQSAPRRSLARC